MSNHAGSCLRLALAALCLGPWTRGANGGAQWQKIGEFRAAGANEIPVNVTTPRCKIECIGKAIVVNTVVVRRDAREQKITVASQLTMGQERVLELGGRSLVTGLRISGSGPGHYAVYVEASDSKEPAKGEKGEDEKGKWYLMGQLRAGGDAKEVIVRREISRFRLRCIRESAIFNTVVVRRGEAKKPVELRLRLTRDQEHVQELGKKGFVTGLRISDDGAGTYRVYVQ